MRGRERGPISIDKNTILVSTKDNDGFSQLNLFRSLIYPKGVLHTPIRTSLGPNWRERWSYYICWGLGNSTKTKMVHHVESWTEHPPNFFAWSTPQHYRSKSVWLYYHNTNKFRQHRPLHVVEPNSCIIERVMVQPPCCQTWNSKLVFFLISLKVIN